MNIRVLEFCPICGQDDCASYIKYTNEKEDIVLYESEMKFAKHWNEIQKTVRRIAQYKGWTHKNQAEKIALMHSELSEALEYLRRHNGLERSDHIPEVLGVEEELADVVIRIMDFAEYHGLDVANAILLKVEYNKTRPHKHGDKRF